jgi:hypothetical protein
MCYFYADTTMPLTKQVNILSSIPYSNVCHDQKKERRKGLLKSFFFAPKFRLFKGSNVSAAHNYVSQSRRKTNFSFFLSTIERFVSASLNFLFYFV